jgi:Family of unknown function (DUF6152)
MRSVIAIAFFIALLACGNSISAHHSMAGFDPSKQVTIEGTVVQVNWTNPHSLFYVEGKVSGSDAPVKKWIFEGPAPTGLMKAGWTKESLNVGDKITATGNPSKQGLPFALLKEVVTAAGKRLATGATINVGERGNREY